MCEGNLIAFLPRITDCSSGTTEAIMGAVAFLLSPIAAHIAFLELYMVGGE